MPLQEHQVDAQSPEPMSEGTLSRRELLKALVAAGGGIAASALLPHDWSTPVVEAAELPAHAQQSPLGVIITTCHLANADPQVPEIGPRDTVEVYAIIRTERADIESIPLRMMLQVDEGGGSVTDLTQLMGTAVILPANDPNEATFGPSLIDLVPFGLVGGSTLIATWTFVNPADSTDTCERTTVLVVVVE
jgi:hypothetical protein